jgi:hypothetical protein
MIKMQLKKRSRSPLFASALALGLGVMQNVSATDTQFGVTLGVGETDNIRRTPTDPMDETIASVGVDASIFQDAKHLYVDVLADLSYLDYLNNTYEREVVGNLDAQLNLRMVPGRFEWLFQDNFGQVRSDPFTPVTPESRENINYFTTGPDATIAFGTQSRLRVLARYSNVNYETSLVDNDRYGAGAAFIREMSPVSFLSLNVQGERVAYRQVSDSDYDSQRAFVRYRLSGSRSEATVEVGYNQLQFEDDTKNGGALFRLDYTRKVSAASTISVNAVHEYTDSSANFRTLQSPGSGTDSAAVVQGSNPYQHTDGGLAWRFAKQRTGFGVGVTYSKEDYQVNDAQDRERAAANINFTRRLTSSIAAYLAGDFSREEYVNTADRFDELVGTVRLTWQMARKLSTEISYQYFDRTSATSIGAYKENRAWLQLRYGTARIPLEARTTQPAESW